VTFSEFDGEDQQMLVATVQNLVARTTWRLRFLRLWHYI